MGRLAAAAIDPREPHEPLRRLDQIVPVDAAAIVAPAAVENVPQAVQRA